MLTHETNHVQVWANQIKTKDFVLEIHLVVPEEIEGISK